MALEAIKLETAQKFDGPRVKQFSVFLKNKVGAFLEVVRLLHVHTVDVIGLSVQDSTDSSIVRLIVSDPEIVESLLGENEIPFVVCEMVVVEIEEVAVDLGRLLASLLALGFILFVISFIVLAISRMLLRPRARA